MAYLEVFWIFCIFSVVTSDTIPSSLPSLYPYSGMQLSSYSNNFNRHLYEGDLMKFRCYLSSLGDPPVTWTWFCGEEQMKNVTYSGATTYMNFTATRKHDGKSCYCRAKSHSSTLFYDHTSQYRYVIRVYHSPRTRPSIYSLSHTTIQSGEYINIMCNLTTLGYPHITWRWICGDQPPKNGVNVGTETYLEIKATARHNGKVCRCRGISSSSSYAYDEVSDPVKITVLSTTDEEPQCITAAAFGATTGLLAAINLALVTILLLWYMRKRKENLCSGGISDKAGEEKSSNSNSDQNPAYVNDQSYEVLQVNRNRR